MAFVGCDLINYSSILEEGIEWTIPTLVLCWSVIVFLPKPSLILFISLLLIICGAAGTIIIGFTYAKESVSSNLSGTAVGICNMGTMIGPMLLQPATGWIHDHFWRGNLTVELRFYDYNAFRWGFALILIWSVMALICSLLSTETSGQQTL